MNLIPESVRVMRPQGLDGVELVQIHRSTQRWSGYVKTWDLCFVAEGSARWRYRGRAMQTDAGQLRLKEPGERFVTERVDAPCTLQIVQLSPARVASWLEALPSARRHFGALQVSLSPDRQRQLRQATARLAGEEEGLSRDTALCALLDGLLTPHLEEAPRPQRAPPRAMRRVYETIVERRFETLSLAELAALAGVHEVYLVRAFRRAYGIPPHALQLELRVEAARLALARGATGAQLAAELGFFDQSHFIRHFKRIVGVTPTQYARAC
ncbi:helix-turn-helix domain-containing protein [Myxococcota bacterium]|nr:helix-turn-helix domain-containing protein [Myxococcota bacterium]